MRVTARRGGRIDAAVARASAMMAVGAVTDALSVRVGERPVVVSTMWWAVPSGVNASS